MKYYLLPLGVAVYPPKLAAATEKEAGAHELTR